MTDSSISAASANAARRSRRFRHHGGVGPASSQCTYIVLVTMCFRCSCSPRSDLTGLVPTGCERQRGLPVHFGDGGVGARPPSRRRTTRPALRRCHGHRGYPGARRGRSRAQAAGAALGRRPRPRWTPPWEAERGARTRIDVPESNGAKNQ
jgi:hypothetical protein